MLTYTWGALENGRELARVRFLSPRFNFRPKFILSPCIELVGPDVSGANALNLIFRMVQHVATTANQFRAFV